MVKPYPCRPMKLPVSPIHFGRYTDARIWIDGDCLPALPGYTIWDSEDTFCRAGSVHGGQEIGADGECAHAGNSRVRELHGQPERILGRLHRPRLTAPGRRGGVDGRLAVVGLAHSHSRGGMRAIHRICVRGRRRCIEGASKVLGLRRYQRLHSALLHHCIDQPATPRPAKRAVATLRSAGKSGELAPKLPRERRVARHPPG